MKAIDAFPPRRDLRLMQAGWALILLSGLAALGIASAASAAGLGEGPSLAIGLVLGGVALLAGEVWLAMQRPPGVGALRARSRGAAKAPAQARPAEQHATRDVVLAGAAIACSTIWVSPPSGRLDSPVKGATHVLHERLDGGVYDPR